MAILSKGCKPNNFESHNSLKHSFANIWGLCFNFIGCESFLEWNSWHFCCIWDKLGWLNWFWEFLCGWSSSFNLKRFCYSYVWSCSLCKGKTSFLDSYLCFWMALIHSVSYFFFHYGSSSFSLCTCFDAIWSNIDEVLLMNPSANMSVFGDFKVHHKDQLMYSGGTARPGELKWSCSDG